MVSLRLGSLHIPLHKSLTSNSHDNARSHLTTPALNTLTRLLRPHHAHPYSRHHPQHPDRYPPRLERAPPVAAPATRLGPLSSFGHGEARSRLLAGYGEGYD